MTTADEILVRRAPAGRTSWDPETRTLELVVSTFADYRRYCFVERLSRAAADWDLSRVSAPGGVPFLDGHNTWSSEARLGRVQSISIGKDGVRAVVKLNTSPGADALIREIEGGTPPGISFGYSVGRWQLADDDAKEIRIAKEICIFEVSAVSVAADPGAHIRTKEASMPNPRNTRYTPVPTAPANSAPPAEQESRDLDPVEAAPLICAGITTYHAIDRARSVLGAGQKSPLSAAALKSIHSWSTAPSAQAPRSRSSGPQCWMPWPRTKTTPTSAAMPNLTATISTTLLKAPQLFDAPQPRRYSTAFTDAIRQE